MSIGAEVTSPAQDMPYGRHADLMDPAGRPILDHQAGAPPVLITSSSVLPGWSASEPGTTEENLIEDRAQRTR